MTVTVSKRIFFWLLVMSFASPLAVAIGGYFYTGHVQRHSDKRWCEMFALLDAPVSPDIQDPAQRERSERIQRAMHDLRIKHGCISR